MHLLSVSCWVVSSCATSEHPSTCEGVIILIDDAVACLPLKHGCVVCSVWIGARMPPLACLEQSRLSSAFHYSSLLIPRSHSQMLFSSLIVEFFVLFLVSDDDFKFAHQFCESCQDQDDVKSGKYHKNNHESLGWCLIHEHKLIKMISLIRSQERMMVGHDQWHTHVTHPFLTISKSS